MGAQEQDLTPKIVASIFMEENVRWLREKFSFMADIWLEVPRENKRIIKGMATRVTPHEESLNAGSGSPSPGDGGAIAVVSVVHGTVGPQCLPG